MANFREVLRHCGNYMVANLSTRALAFISIPVYTRILSPYEYGTVNLFLGVLGILSSVLTLCLDQSVSRYYYDKEDLPDFRRFVGTSSGIALIIFLINALLLVSLAGPFGRLVNLDKSLVYLLIPMSFINIVGLTFEQIFNPMKMSKKIALASMMRVYLGFLFSVLFILMMSRSRYFGHIYGQITAGLIMLAYWGYHIRNYFTFCIKKEYIKYILNYSVPLVPYVLSGVVIAEFAKITIARVQTTEEVGFYNLAIIISGIVSILVYVTNQAWNPYYFGYMNKKDYTTHDRDIDRIFRITLIAALAVSCFGQELGSILAKKDFTSSLFLIPILVYGPLMHQVSYIYMRNLIFARKTVYMSVIVITSGAVNILLNIFLIPAYGQPGAAISFVFSYIVMALLSWWISKKIIRVHTTSPWLIIKPVLIYLPFSAGIFLLSLLPAGIWPLLAKVIILLIFSLAIIWSDRRYLWQTASSLLKKLQ